MTSKRYSHIGVAVNLLTLLAVSACGQRTSREATLEFIQSRPNSQRYAYLQSRDTVDTFLFGASVIKTTGFTSSGLNMVLRPQPVNLAERKVGKNIKLDVISTKTGSAILSFDLNKVGKRREVDFASAGNDLTLRSIVNQVGGMSTAQSEDGYWVSTSAPEVLNVSQDEDTMVVDLEHTIQQARTERDIFGRLRIAEIISEKPGQVVVRIYLKRQKALPEIGKSERTVEAGKKRNIGFFGSDFVGQSDAVPIQRYNVGDVIQPTTSITYYLKDVPEKYEAIAKRAVLSWNKAFGQEILSVERAPEGVDVGDPRYHVIKWFDGTDNTISWAGVAKMIVNPKDGLVMSGSLYIQGETLLKLYGDIVTYSEAVTADPFRRLEGRIGNIDFENEQGERPVAAFLTNVDRNFDEYMQNYYLETIAHEVGHTLGLRHNFKASTKLTDGESASVMDYAPRAERDKYTQPGSYDLAAIRWAYFGEEPKETLPFCTDENLWESYDCNQGDWGDPIRHTTLGLIDATMLIAQKPVAITRPELISSFGGSLEIAYKIRKLIKQVPEAQRSDALENVNAAIAYINTALPDSTLGTEARKTVEANLILLRELAKKTEDKLRAAGNL